MRPRKVGWIWAAFVTLGLALGGCGDSNVFKSLSNDSSDAAKRESGIDALDSGNYDAAAKVFEELWAKEKSPEVARYLASAYVGQAGFDTLSLVEEIAKAQDAEGSAASRDVIYDSVTRIFAGNDSGTITGPELEAKRALIAKALGVLVPGPSPVAGVYRAAAAHAAEMTDDERFQAGLYAAIHAVLGIASRLEFPADSGTFLLTLDALRAHAEIIGSATVPQGFEDDLALIRDARDVLIEGLTSGSQTAEDNDIADEFDKFLASLGYAPPGDVDVTDAELRAFLTDLIQ